MGLLILSNNPDRASFRQRIGIYLPQLKAAGVACAVEKLPRGYWARWRLFVQTGEFDAVLLHKKTLNLWDAQILRKYARKIIYDFDDAVMYSPRTPQNDSSSHFNPFRRTAKLADLVIAGNLYLAEHAKRFNSNVEVLPTGLDTSAYKVHTNPKDNGKIRLVWIGSKSTLRYLAEIKPVLEEIGSRFDNVILRIICDDFINLQNMPVEKRLWSEETQAIDLATCDIGLAPLPDNRFTRGKCGFKILQYAAAGLPVAASPVGANTEYIQQAENGFLADGTSDWIDKICRLISEPQLRKKMGQKGLVNVKQFDLRVIERPLIRYIKGCIESG